jgi:hypothetical protein
MIGHALGTSELVLFARKLLVIPYEYLPSHMLQVYIFGIAD